jgi:phosphoglucosamine mutase
MREGGLNLGGEQSGHIILSDLSTTGDGLISALQVLAVLAQAHKNGSPVKMSALARQFEPAPQKLVNVRYAAGSDPLSSDLVQSAIKEGEARLNGSGRVLVRASGTEALIRVMAEGDDERLVAKVVQSIAQAVKQAAA